MSDEDKSNDACEQAVDPTGAGDTFAGAAMGYIAKKGESRLV